MCVYNYKAVQEDFEDEVQQNATVTAIVEASCDAGKLHCEFHCINTCTGCVKKLPLILVNACSWRVCHAGCNSILLDLQEYHDRLQ